MKTRGATELQIRNYSFERKAPGKTRRGVSARAGLVAVLETWRSLELSKTFEDRDANILEALLLMKASGVDCVHDAAHFFTDPLWSKVLSQPAEHKIKSVLRSFFSVDQTAPDPMAMTVKRILEVLKAVERWDYGSLTLDFVEVPCGVERWGHADVSPTFVLCYCREVDLIVAGQKCREPSDTVKVINAAVNTARSRLAPTIWCRGQAFVSPIVLDWFASPHHEFRVIQGNEQKTKKTAFRFAVQSHGFEVGSDDQQWTDLDTSEDQLFAWFQKNAGNGELREIIVTPKGRDGVRNSAFVIRLKTNRETQPEMLIAECLRGMRRDLRIVEDMHALTTGIAPDALTGPFSDGQFAVAILAYNLCALVRKLAFGGETDNGMSLCRFRDRFLHTAGNLAKTKSQSWFFMHDPLAQERFARFYDSLRKIVENAESA